MDHADYAHLLGTTPTTILRPDHPEAVAAAIVEAASAGQAVIPWGGGTGQTYGYVPERAEVLLDLSGMNRVIAHEPGDLTLTVEAGTTLDTIQETLAQHNQFLPLDPPHPARATVGGILATDAHGPSRVGYGKARDWLIGITVLDAQGRLIKGGGKVVKNVTGYDLPKLHVGALGTLGVIVEATFKVAPRPDALQPLIFPLSPDETSHTALFLTRLLHDTSPAFGLLRDEADSRAAVFLYNGPEAVVSSEAERAVGAGSGLSIAPSSALPTGMGSPFSSALPETGLIVRFTGAAKEAVERHAAIAALGFWQRVDTLPGIGQTDAYLFPEADPEVVARQVIQWAEGAHTAFTFLQAPLSLRRRERDFPLWSPLPSSLPLMRRLKEALDPTNILNPNRFVGGI